MGGSTVSLTVRSLPLAINVKHSTSYTVRVLYCMYSTYTPTLASFPGLLACTRGPGDKANTYLCSCLLS